MRKLGRTPPTKARPLKECMDFFESEGVSRIVCMGRDMDTGTPGCDTVLDNAYIAQIVAEEPERIIGIAGINPLKPDAVQNVRHAIKNLGLKGVSMDPAFMDLYADDERIYPVYEECARLGVPVILTLGRGLRARNPDVLLHAPAGGPCGSRFSRLAHLGFARGVSLDAGNGRHCLSQRQCLV